MAEFASVRTVADFRRLNDGATLEGYLNVSTAAPSLGLITPGPFGMDGATDGSMRVWRNPTARNYHWIKSFA
jgi:hypothetical protein